ncbi:hypothetical protein Godav_010894, partial [Gossypium davidsonii]|nr:hypothetical protein [Gossypium davidsonii]
FANNSLFQLHNLQCLDLSSNNLGGSLLENTSCLFHFHGLRQLNLAYNAFDGAISTELFSQLVSLTHLNLSHNGFYGLIPHQINLLSSLVSLDLSFNSFESIFDGEGFDMLARNLTKLRNLVLDSVDMSDVALTSFLNLSSSLEHLSLSGCKLHGELPTQVFQLPNLKVLDVISLTQTGVVALSCCTFPIVVLGGQFQHHLEISFKSFQLTYQEIRLKDRFLMFLETLEN